MGLSGLIATVKEIWEQAIRAHNMPLTVLLGVVFLFWVVSLLTGGDIDADMDVDVDVDTGVDTHGLTSGILRLVNAQDVPLTLVISVLTLFMWGISIVSNYYLNPNENGWVAFGLFLLNFIISVLLVKAVTQPLRPFFRALKNDQEHKEPLIGSAGHVKSRVLDGHFGQCEIVRPKGAPALLNCRLAEGEEAMVRDEEILVIGYDDKTQKYIVKSNNTQN